MLKKTVKYTNFNDEAVEETHYFHLTKADIVKLQAGHQGGMEKYLERIIESNDGAKIMAEFENIIRLAYGKKSEDGTRFIKNEQITEEFLSSEAYSEIFMALVTDSEAAAAFINGIMPKGLAEDLAAMGQPEAKKPLLVTDAEAARNLGDPKPGSDLTGVPETEEQNVFDAANPRILTQAEVIEMDSDELKSGLATGRYKLQ